MLWRHIRGAEVWLHLILAVGGGEWLASRPGRFTPGGKNSGTQWAPEAVGMFWITINILPPLVFEHRAVQPTAYPKNKE